MRVPASSDSNSGEGKNLVVYDEPTSVLGLRQSPSPTAVEEKPLVSGGDNQFPSDDHAMRSMDWDSIMRELELDDDSTPNLKPNLPPSSHFAVVDPPLPVIPDQLNPYGCDNNEGGGGFDVIEDLIRVADYVDTDELQHAHVILSRLNQRLRSPTGRPLLRAAFYFNEALGSLLSGTNRNQNRLTSWTEIVERIRAIKEFSGISPIPLFSHFTANQAILDSLHHQSSSPFAHIVDFEIGFGGQYASLMREIAEKSSVTTGGFLRVTAVVPEESAVETRLVKENLVQFAADLKIRFQIDFVLMRTFEMLSFKAIRFVEGERTVVLISPAIFHGISGFVNDLRRVSPNVVVLVDSEGWNGISGAGSFQREFVSGLEFYTTVLESLDAAAAAPNCDLVKKIIETFVLRPKIAVAVEAAAVNKRQGGGEMMTWREAFCAAGMRMVPLSQFVDFQAECLVEKAQVRGFHVAKRQGELVLCWHGRPLVATSAWRF